jgi:hypothetical protein
MKPTSLLISGLLFFSSMASAQPLWKDQARFDVLKKKRGIEAKSVAQSDEEEATLKPSPRKIVNALKNLSPDEFKSVLKMDKPTKL